MNSLSFPYSMKRLACLCAALLITFSARAQVSMSGGVTVLLWGGSTLSVADDLDLQHASIFMLSSVTLAMKDGSVLSMGSGSQLWMDGVEGKANPRLTAISGYFSTDIKAGALIDANHAVFERMSGYGLHLKAGALVIDEFNRPPLLGCIFRDGSPGSTLLRVDNEQDLVIDKASFYGGAGGATVNVYKTVNAGQLTFTNFGGDLGGPSYENDPHGTIFWDGGGAVPENRLVDNVTVGSGDARCFDAELVVTVQNTVVQGNASLYLVAGQRIRLLPGFRVHEGGYLHAHITTSGLYCDPPALVAAAEQQGTLPGGLPGDRILPPAWKEQEALSITVYPNPTAGRFSLALSGWEEASMVTILVYDMLGNVVVRRELPPAALYALDLTAQQPGLYVVRAVVGQQLLTSRIVRQ